MKDNEQPQKGLTKEMEYAIDWTGENAPDHPFIPDMLLAFNKDFQKEMGSINYPITLGMVEMCVNDHFTTHNSIEEVTDEHSKAIVMEFIEANNDWLRISGDR